MTIAPEQNPEPIFPADLLETADPSAAATARTWYVARVKSRREKALASFLFHRSIGYYLPLVKQRQSSNRRIRYSLVPVFSGYVFVYADIEERYSAFTSNHVSRMIEVKDPETLLQELKQVYLALSAGQPVYPVEFVSVGRRVRVKTGPMKDVEGIVVRKDKKFRLVLNVTTIMQSVSIQVDADMVEPV